MPKPIYHTLPDGTLKHVNPLTGTEVWTVPERAFRPFNKTIHPPKPLNPVSPENYCDFCEANYFKVPPEKARLIRTPDGQYQSLQQVSPDKLHQTQAIFRRVGNLFEIVTLDFWLKNHPFQISPAQAQWKKDYIANPQGLAHVLQMISTKLKFIGKTDEDLAQIPVEEKLRLADAFFAGGHELIIGSRHIKPNAPWDTDLVSAGELSPEEHYQYLRFTMDALNDIYAQNPFIRYVMVFQNWLHPAGASVEHLHRQLVGMDQLGPATEHELSVVEKNPAIYNESIINFSIEEKLVVAETDHAIAIAEIGHPFPTLGIYSKSQHLRPEDHSPEELKSMSDLIHACHAATGNQTPCNEEWYYTPRGSQTAMPWHVLIKWRVNTSAGFEGGTKIYLNPVKPLALKNLVVPKLFELRSQKKIGQIKIGDECSEKRNPLQYN